MSDYMWMKCEPDTAVSTQCWVVRPVSRSTGHVLPNLFVAYDSTLYDESEVAELPLGDETLQLQDDLELERQRVADLRQENKNLEEDLDYEKRRATDYESEVEDLVRDNTNLRHINDELGKEVRVADETIEQLKRERDELRSTAKPVSGLKADADSYREQNEYHTKHKHILVKRLSEYETIINGLVKAGKAMCTNIEALDADYISPIKASARVWKKRTYGLLTRYHEAEEGSDSEEESVKKLYEEVSHQNKRIDELEDSLRRLPGCICRPPE